MGIRDCLVPLCALCLAVVGCAGSSSEQTPGPDTVLADLESHDAATDFIPADLVELDAPAAGDSCEPFIAPPGAPTKLADDFPVAHTPDCAWTTFPQPILAECTEPLVADAADLRGLWQDVAGTHIERIEQCGNRVIIVSTGVTHDMRTDGTLEHGVNDVSQAGCMSIQVAAAWVDGRLELRPFGGNVAVTRERVGEQLKFVYAGKELLLEQICTLP